MQEKVAWIFLAICVLTYFIVGSARAPKLIKDQPGLLSSSCEKSLKNYNKSWDKKYDTQVSVAFVTNFNTVRRSEADYVDYYWDKTDLDENDMLFVFFCKNGSINDRQSYGNNFMKLYDRDPGFALMIDEFITNITDKYDEIGDSDSDEYDSITKTFFSNLDEYFQKTTCPRDCEEYFRKLAGEGDSNGIGNVVSGVAGFVSTLISSLIGRIMAIGIVPTIIIIIIIVSVFKGRRGTGNTIG